MIHLREDHGSIEAFMEGQPAEIRPLLYQLHGLIASFPGVYGKIAYKIPFYYRKSWICYLNPLRGGGVELAFTRGNELHDESGLLEARGRTQVRGICFQRPSDIDTSLIEAWMQQALLLDAAVPYRSPAKRAGDPAGSSFDTPEI
jgi:hypothetical protein